MPLAARPADKFEVYKKHHPPSLLDEVWRLEKIGKMELSTNASVGKTSPLFLALPKTGVVFNLVGQVMGLLSGCQYVPIEKLFEAKKVDAHNLVISAFQHWEEVVSFDEEAYLIAGSSHVSSAPRNSSSPKTEGSKTCRFLSCERIGGLDYAQPNASSLDIMSSIYSKVDVSGLDDYTLHGMENMGLRYDQTLSLIPNSQVARVP
ncbi:calmodulin-binding protein 60 A-like [Eucalyptus grandis]|uniref:calmodulin-binding protein 60 A-like n=1 Tax=Eucalyptus grandis TaxID=71139 RepID=UPI00192EB166|nr:calmodulin-binding protein 60 A-like [Eucalyptus grandis]